MRGQSSATNLGHRLLSGPSCLATAGINNILHMKFFDRIFFLKDQFFSLTRPTTPKASAIARIQTATPASPSTNQSSLGTRIREDTPLSDIDLGEFSSFLFFPDILESTVVLFLDLSTESPFLLFLGDQTFHMEGSVVELHQGKQQLSMVVFKVERVFNIPVS